MATAPALAPAPCTALVLYAVVDRPLAAPPQAMLDRFHCAPLTDAQRGHVARLLGWVAAFEQRGPRPLLLGEASAGMTSPHYRRFY